MDELIAGGIAAASFAAILQIGGTLDPKTFDSAGPRGTALCAASYALAMSVIELLRLRWGPDQTLYGRKSPGGLLLVVIAVLIQATAIIAAIISIGEFLVSISLRMQIWYLAGYFAGLTRAAIIWASRRV